MSTLRTNLDLLLDLQRIDTENDRLTRLRRNLDTGDSVNDAARKAQDAANWLRADHQKVAGNLKDFELELATLEKKLKSYEDRVRSGVIANSKELMNTEKEIGQLIKQRAALDEEILSLMDEVEHLSVQVKTADEQASELDQRRKAAMETLDEQRNRLDHAIAELGSKRVDLVATIDDAALLKRYETIRARGNSAGIAIGRTQDNICGGCHMQVSSIEATKARAGETLIVCENCGRIMA